jgi:4-hydroxy-tetrahydrodipicolinate synthase
MNTERKTKTVSGVIIPMITPVTSNNSIDTASLRVIMKTFTQKTVSVFLLGTTGESTSFTESDKFDFVKNVIDNNPHNIPVYAGISSNSLKESIHHAKTFASYGVNAVVAHLPFYYPMSPEDMVWYFEELANKIDCPLILYNNPITVKESIPLEVVEKLSHHKNIIGFKDSERGLERLDKAIELWKDREDFSFLLGWAAQSAYAMLKGCDGIVPSTGNLTPQLYQDLYDAAIKGDSVRANELQELTNEVSLVYQKDRNISQSIPALKTLLSAFGLCQPYAIPPMQSTPETEQENLKTLIKTKLDDLL